MNILKFNYQKIPEEEVTYLEFLRKFGFFLLVIAACCLISAMIFVNNSKLIHRQVGALPEPMLRDLFEQFVNLSSEAETTED